VTANVSDDVQVRNVEFYVDGVKAITDGNFPFEFRFATPTLSADKTSFRVHARATDTGGNSTVSDERVITIVPDATSPQVKRIVPSDGTKLGGAETVSAFFSENIAPATLTAGTFALKEAGADHQLGTSDDVPVSGGTIAYREDLFQASINFSTSLPFGLYELTVSTGIRDRAGNALQSAAASRFELTELTIIAERGTPADVFQASANAGQTITIRSPGLTASSKVIFPTRNDIGTAGQREVAVSDIAPDGTFGKVTVPVDAETGQITLPDGAKLFLQIVPVVTAMDGGPGRFTVIFGSGFIEGFVTVRCGPVEIPDGGSRHDDGIDVRAWDFENNRIDVNLPANAALPYEVITEGGSSGRAIDVIRMASTARTGTPSHSSEASANVGQKVTLEGSGFVADVTKVTLEAMRSDGVPFVITIKPDSVAPDGASLVFTVPPDARTGFASIISGGAGKLLQIVPVVLAIDGGPGRFTSLFGSGFVEGLTSVRLGPRSVVDAGPGGDDGIDVRSWNFENNRLDLTAPADAALPYEVITEGGSSGTLTDVTIISAAATTGTPANAAEASANVGQKVTLEGSGFAAGVTKVTLEAMRNDGLPYITTVEPDSVAGDGTSVVFTVPAAARTGAASILGGGRGKLLQIVPKVFAIEGGHGRASSLFGSGFIEGFTTVRCGAQRVIDGGPQAGDGIDVRAWDFENNRMDLNIPADGTLPYEVITEGGSSGRVTDVTEIPSVSDTGTPARVTEASANVGQKVTIEGSGFVADVTKVTIEAMRNDGLPYITTLNPDSVTADGNSLVFTVPAAARSGVASILNGGSGKVLQIVPKITVIDGGPGRSTSIYGSGFIEGFTTVRFGSKSIVDGGVNADDGIDVRAWDSENNRMDLAVPTEGTLPYEVITEGGSSGRTTDMARIVSAAAVGTPAHAADTSANVAQKVTIAGSGFAPDVTKVTLEAMRNDGLPYIITVNPDSVAADGSSLVFTVPAAARTGVASILNGGSGELLQIVPMLDSVSAATPGSASVLFGSGFVEGATTVRFGAVDLIDTSASDSLNVRA
jgi:hypothetical protein